MGEITTFKKYIEDGLKDTIHDFTENGDCSNCGNCCNNMLPMSKKEIDRINKYIKKNNIKENRNLTPFAVPPIDMTCPFRDSINKICTIYEVRPKICRVFICNQPEKDKENRDKFAKNMNIVNNRQEFFGSRNK